MRPHMPRNEVVEAFGVGSPRPRAEVEAVGRVGMGEGKPRTAAKSQIVAAAFYPQAHGLAPGRGKGRCLEAGIAAGNQQKRYARAALMLAEIGACSPRLA